MTDPTPTVTALRPPKWPKPKLDKIVLDTVQVAAAKPPKSPSARVNLLKKALRLAAEQLIPAAEQMIDADGPTKKRLVHEQLVDLLHALEKKLNLIPDFLEPVAFKAIEAVLDSLIQATYDKLKARGVLDR